ncbi:AAEL002955-PB [Aedes aegypti]|uniref:AAEL002955-PB n=1 Tax=Aedes aegypti TaxID=7159 RepID=Q17GL2_AEDAE|nr:AAEL002955-PB [Aedes aegypti]
MKSITCLAVLSAAALFGVVSCASIASNLVVDATPRIATSEQLLSSIVNECFEDDSVMNCLKGKVLVYLDGVLGLREEQARAFEEQNVDKVIFDRVARILATHEFKVQLPEDTVVSYRADKGVNLDVVPAGLATVLLLLKLKMKALMPIFVALIGLKAMKALILSKLAITLVLGFIVAQLVKKSGLGMPMMSMMPMMPPAAEYGAPAPATTEPPSSYGAPSWESQSGGPYSRVWEPSTSSSSHNLAYSSYYPSGSSSSYSSTAYNSGSSTSSSSSPSSSSSSSSSSSNSAHAY